MARIENQQIIVLDIPAMQRLIFNKTKEIEELEQHAQVKKEERLALEGFLRHLLNPQLSFNWEEFLEQLSPKNPELVNKLRICEVNCFDVGKLKITAPRFEATLIRLYKEVLRAELFEFTGAQYYVDIRDSEKTEGR